MKTSYREISKTEFEVSVVTDKNEKVILGIVSTNLYGKWNCTHSYFPIHTFEQDAVENTDSMVECGRGLVKAWKRYNAQQKFENKLKQLKLSDRLDEFEQKVLEDEYYDSLWDLSPFEGDT